MRSLNGFEERAGPLRYQEELLRNGHFRLSDTLTSSRSIVISDKSVLYFFEESARYAVIAVHLGFGFPLTGLIDIDQSSCYNLGDANWGIRTDHLERFGSALEGCEIEEGEPAPYVLTGDPNYAHVLWNQVGAISRSQAMDTEHRFTYVATHEPLGPLQHVVPGLPAESIVRIHDFEISRLNSGRPKLWIPAGGTMIRTIDRTRLVDDFVRDISPYAKSILSAFRGSPVMILTLRSHNRTATNLAEMLAAIADAVLTMFPNTRVLLDGHSLPADIDRNLCYVRKNVDQVCSDQRDMASDIRSLTSESVRNRIHVAVGLDIRDSIAIGSAGSSYFAHHGTVQHKIAWLHNIFGVVHSNPRTLQLLPAVWAGDQLEGGIRPAYIPIELVAEEGAEAKSVDGPIASLYHENYRFVDISATTAFVIDSISEYFGQ